MKKINKIFSLSLLGIMFFSVFAIFFPQEINAADGCSRRCLPYATGMDITTLCATTSNETSAAYALLGLATPELLTDGVCTGQPSMTCPAGSIAACCCCSTCAYTAPAPPTPNTAQQYAQQQVNNWAQTQTISILPKYNNPELQIKLPINFGQVDCKNNSQGGFACSISWIGDYVAYVYRYGLSVAGILAAIVMMAGGVMWLTSGGDSGQVSKAKSFISGSVIGLLILFSTYMILYQINPGLTELNPIRIGYKDDFNSVIGGSSPVTSTPVELKGGLELLVKLTGWNCGQDSLSEMANKSKGKITYSQAKKTKPGPENTIYLDCSTYARLMLECAGIKGVPETSSLVFTSQQPLFDKTLNNLKVGDLVGWAPTSSAGGHVLIYLGNGSFVDVYGKNDIKNPSAVNDPGKGLGFKNLDYVNKTETRFNITLRVYKSGYTGK